MKRILDHAVLVCLFFGTVTFTSCRKEVTLPILSTNSVTDITISSLTSGGNITKSGGADVTARGVCWATTRNPVITGSHTNDGKGSGNFDSNLSGLNPNTTYYIRAFATNSAGTAYGNELPVTTSELTVPVLTTVSATEITYTTASSGGNISADGGAAVTARGICWSTSANPTSDGNKTTNGSGTGTFTSNLTGLVAGTIYHVRAYATNSVGTGYGSDITFTTSALAAPSLTTAQITSITLTTAVSGGDITSDGGADVTVRGICWAKTAIPTTAGDKTTNGTGTGVFTGNLTGLEPGTTYHVRAYATNSTGTGYGNEITFETSPVEKPTLTTTSGTALGTTTAVSGGVISADGGGAVTARGVCWATTAAPTTGNDKTTNGTGTGTFTSNISGLLPATIYHLRAYATNSAGTAYGDEIIFTTLSIALPVLSTTGVSSVTLTTAISGGNISSDGGGAVSARGVCWATTATPTISNFKTSNGTGTGAFSSSLTSLTPGTTYYLRAYATNSAGTSYGNEVIFSTASAVVPTLTTASVTSITLATASSGGNISADGGATVTQRGVCWSTTATPTLADSKTTNGTGTGSFTSSITGLASGTVYHVRAYATNSAGTAYGNDVQFTTTPVTVPVVTTDPVSSISTTTAVSGGNITSNGGALVTISGICWGTTANPTTADSKTTDGTPSGNFPGTMTGLTMGTIYYVRAYATNSAGTAYGNQITFGSRMADIEGNTYGTVAIGTQVWMTENMRTVKLADGTAIPNVTDNTDWTLLSTMAYSWFGNNISYKPVYGALYNWFTVNTGDLCPTGWHVPQESDFDALELYLGMDAADVNTGWVFRGTDQGTQLKSTTGWLAGQNGTNTTGFTALPGGYRFAIDGTFNNLPDLAYFWSSTELDATQAWYRRLDGVEARVFKGAVEKRGGKYVRCMKN